MIHPLRAWNRFFFQPTSARPLGLIRILFGLVALGNLAFCAVDLEFWYTDQGLIQGDAIRAIAGRFQQSPFHYLQDPNSIKAAFAFTATAALFLTVGFRTRLMSILFYVGMLSIHFRNTMSSSGADVLLLTIGFNLMLSPCGLAYSVDSWSARRKRGGTEAEGLILPWSLRLIQVQISLIYLIAGILKSSGMYWQNGTALHYVFTNTEVRRFDLSFLCDYPTLINLMTYGALISELVLAFFIWFRACRPFVLWLGVMLHAGILVSINIPCFGELMCIGYLAFLTPPEFNRFVAAFDLRRLLGRVPASLAPEPTPAPAPFPGTTTIRIDGPSAATPRPHLADLDLDFLPEPTRPVARSESAPVDDSAFAPFQILF